MRNLNPDQLHAFLTVVEQGSFTAAAKVLNLTQPAVSLQIRELESRCGMVLLDREGRRPRLTPAGKALLDHARQILDGHERALAAMRRLKDTAVGRVRVGMSTTTLTYVAAPALRLVKAEHPSITLVVELGTSPRLTEQVRDNDLDLALVTLPVEERDLKVTAFAEDDLVAIFPAGVKDLPTVATPAYMAEQMLVVDQRTAVLKAMIADWFAAGRVEPQIGMEIEHLEAIKSAVAATLGAAIVPDALVRHRPPDLAVLPLKPRMTRKIAMIQRADKPPHEALTVLRKALLAARNA